MMPVEDMDLEELRQRLFDALWKSQLNQELSGFVKGFANGIKAQDPKRPSQRQITIARRLVSEIRHHDGSEPDDLIDADDTETGREMAKNEAEF